MKHIKWERRSTSYNNTPILTFSSWYYFIIGEDKELSSGEKKSCFSPLIKESSKKKTNKQTPTFTSFPLKSFVLLFRFLRTPGHLNFPSVLVASGWTITLCYMLAFKYGIWNLTDVSLQYALQCLQSSHDIPDHRPQHLSLKHCHLPLMSYVRWKWADMNCKLFLHMTLFQQQTPYR